MENKKSIFSSISPQDNSQVSSVSEKVVEDLKRSIDKITEKLNLIENKITTKDESDKKNSGDEKLIDFFKKYLEEICKKVDFLENKLDLIEKKVKSDVDFGNLFERNFIPVKENLNLIENKILSANEKIIEDLKRSIDKTTEKLNLIENKITTKDESDKKNSGDEKLIDFFKKYLEEICKKVDFLENKLDLIEKKVKSDVDFGNLFERNFIPVKENLNLIENKILSANEKIIENQEKIELMITKENVLKEEIKNLNEKVDSILKKDVLSFLKDYTEDIKKKFVSFDSNIINEIMNKIRNESLKEISLVTGKLHGLHSSTAELVDNLKNISSNLQQNVNKLVIKFENFMEEFKKEILNDFKEYLEADKSFKQDAYKDNLQKIETLVQSIEKEKKSIEDEIKCKAELRESVVLINNLYKISVLMQNNLYSAFSSISKIDLRNIGGASEEILPKIIIGTKEYFRQLKENINQLDKLRKTLYDSLKIDQKDEL